MEITFQHHVVDTDDKDELQDSLDLLGDQGFQIQTCQAIPMLGVQGVTSLRYFAVLTLPIYPEEDDDDPEEQEEEDHNTEDSNVVAMRMK
jgi:hypothetical protein